MTVIDHQYDLMQEPRGSLYQQLISASLRYCQTFLLVVRHSPPLAESGHATLRQLRAYLVDLEESPEWPGTRLFDDRATVSRFQLNNETATLLSSTVDGLYSWMQPAFPEDLCILRDDGTPWLVSIAHERDGYLLLTSDESAELATIVPGLVPAQIDQRAITDEHGDGNG